MSGWVCEWSPNFGQFSRKSHGASVRAWVMAMALKPMIKHIDIEHFLFFQKICVLARISLVSLSLKDMQMNIHTIYTYTYTQTLFEACLEPAASPPR